MATAGYQASVLADRPKDRNPVLKDASSTLRRNLSSLTGDSSPSGESRECPSRRPLPILACRLLVPFLLVANSYLSGLVGNSGAWFHRDYNDDV